MMTLNRYLKIFFSIILLAGLAHAAVIALFYVNPKLFFFRSAEYFTTFSNKTLDSKDSFWVSISH